MECGIILRRKKQSFPLSPVRKGVYGLITEFYAVFSYRVFCAEKFCFSAHFLSVEPKRRCSGISTKKTQQINEEITAPQVRVIGSDGEQLGIMEPAKALAIAEDEGYDLVLIAPTAEPPVCRIMDFGKYCFEQEKKEKEARKRQQTVELKEIRLSYRIDVHDFETKVKHAHRFLDDGNKVRVAMRFKGREIAHIALGRETMTRFEEACSEFGTVDKKPVLDGKILSMVVSPKKTK